MFQAGFNAKSLGIAKNRTDMSNRDGIRKLSHTVNKEHIFAVASSQEVLAASSVCWQQPSWILGHMQVLNHTDAMAMDILEAG